ncbi:MAG TPA: IS630 family transposase [Desulfobacterales bacterium]|nr:IS630 family transposase [Desulfobacterales bacterium]
MLYVSSLTEAETLSLQSMNRAHPRTWTRVRANAILLSHEGQPLQAIASIHGVSRQTVSIWLKNWETKGLCGLIDKSGRGRRKKLPSETLPSVLDMVSKSPRSLKHVLDRIEKEWGVKISKSTLKRLCKKANLSWKRIRKSLKGKRDPVEFEASVIMIKAFIQQADRGEIDLVYFDESGFTLEPCIPYAWQDRKETIGIPSAKSTRLNVLGFMNRQGPFESYVFEGSVNSSVVVAAFDQFAKTLTKKTVVILDNASIHTSTEFKENIETWEAQGLRVQPIAAYSPELNLIEILWRKIKYEWISFSAYTSFSALKEALFEILANIGGKYKVNFT